MILLQLIIYFCISTSVTCSHLLCRHMM